MNGDRVGFKKGVRRWLRLQWARFVYDLYAASPYTIRENMPPRP